MKPTFPASYSTLCAGSLAELVANNYPLDHVTCTFLVRGVGDTYQIDSSQGRFILRVYRTTHRSLSNVQAEVALLLNLKQAAVAVSFPIADRTGETIQLIDAIEGQRYAVLFSYAPGQSAKTLNKAQLGAFGYEMARFHQVSSAITLPGDRWIFDTNTTLFSPLERLRSAFTNDQESYAWLLNAAQKVDSHLSSIDTTAFSMGYCHFDFLPKNMHFEKDSVTFFDFDFMGYGWLVYDIVSFWQHLAIEVYAGRRTQQALNEDYAIFLTGYQANRVISEQELRLVPRLALGFWLFYMGFHTTHDQFYSYTESSQLKAYTGFLKYLETTYWDQ